jgi:hypothetical protein
MPYEDDDDQTDSFVEELSRTALSSMFGKIIDNIILTRSAELFTTNELQFGFKCEHSSHMRTMIIKETISYYTHNQSSVYCTFLNVTKAFDRVQYCKLFNLL